MKNCCDKYEETWETKYQEWDSENGSDVQVLIMQRGPVKKMKEMKRLLKNGIDDTGKWQKAR